MKAPVYSSFHLRSTHFAVFSFTGSDPRCALRQIAQVIMGHGNVTCDTLGPIPAGLSLYRSLGTCTHESSARLSRQCQQHQHWHPMRPPCLTTIHPILLEAGSSIPQPLCTTSATPPSQCDGKTCLHCCPAYPHPLRTHLQHHTCTMRAILTR